jgi:hypothetical protein
MFEPGDVAIHVFAYDLTLGGRIVIYDSLRQLGAPNVLTLSCKNRLTCAPREAAGRLPRPTRSGRSELQPT